ncbi:unnamed protein product, partial [Polarella glacialis]
PVIDPAAQEFFRQQRIEDAANDACADCGTSDPQWASVSHGVYISIDASGVHRSLGVQVSFVQSLKMDSWKPVHLKMMELGGNRRFTEFLQTHGVPADMPIREKYSTRAAQWYRKNLRAEAEGLPGPCELPGGTGQLPASSCSPQGSTEKVLDIVYGATIPKGSMSLGGVLFQHESVRCALAS